ncbi:MAG: hypothetical protein AAF674_16900 [Pseudomonadota bacterium]
MAKQTNLIPIDGKGRHHKPNLKYDEDMCWHIREMAQDGKFQEEWCAELGVSMHTLWQWTREHENFRDAYGIACHVLQAYWTRYARENLTNPNLRSSVLIKMLQSRFPQIYGGRSVDGFEAWKGMISEFMQQRDAAEQNDDVEEPDDVGRDDETPIVDERTASTSHLMDRLDALRERRRHDQ